MGGCNKALFSTELLMDLKKISRVFLFACLGIVFFSTTTLAKGNMVAESQSQFGAYFSTMDKVTSRTKLLVIRGNEGSSQASGYDPGDVVTLKKWRSGAETLDGSGNTNMRVSVTMIFPGIYCIDPAYGDPIYAIPVIEKVD